MVVIVGVGMVVIMGVAVNMGVLSTAVTMDMSMLVAVGVRMLMAVIAVKTFVHSCLLSVEKGQTGALLHIGTSYLRYYIYFFPFNQL